MSAADDLRVLQERVANGITWLVAHDPTGAFHLWYEAGITPVSPMPAHAEDDARERYTEYYRARRTFDKLDTELGRLDPQWAPVPLGPAEWQPAKEVRK